MAFLERASEFHLPPPPGASYSVSVPGSEQPGRTPIYRHWRFKDGVLKSLDPNVKTAHDLFESSANRNPKSLCLGWRPYDSAKKTWGKYQWLDYSTVQRRRANFGVGIVKILQEVDALDKKNGIGLWCQNRPEWQITDLACMSQGMYTVSLYDTLGPSTSEYIINHASLPCVATSLPHIPQLLNLKPRLPSLKVIVSLDPLDNGEPDGYSKRALLDTMASDLGVKIYSIDQVEALGASFGVPQYHPPSSDDIITINYTSGTTGPPKGVVLTHSAAVAAASCALITVTHKPGHKIMSYLPLAHIFERMTEIGALWAGGAIGFFHGDILALVDDLQTLRPNAFISVPRLYNRFGGAIQAATVQQPGIKGSIARHIINTKLAAMEVPEPPSATNTHAVYDRLWGRKVAAALGLDQATDFVSGAAPLDPTLHKFFRAAFGARVVQGFGMTETYGQGLCQHEGDMSTGNCGGAAATLELCLRDVPDMEYYSTDKPQPRGELLVRGSSLFKGYFKNPEETEKALLPDGWLCTGDIATIDKRGRFRIVDRRKNVLKLAQGEYISPERQENVYLSHLNYLAMAFVHGDSDQSFLVAILAVQPDMFAPFAAKIVGHAINPTDMDAIRAACDDERVIRAVQADLDQVGRKNKFAGYERVRKAALKVEPFSIQNELLTPTLKLKRPPTVKMYRSLLDELYGAALKEDEAHPRAKL